MGILALIFLKRKGKFLGEGEGNCQRMSKNVKIKIRLEKDKKRRPTKLIVSLLNCLYTKNSVRLNRCYCVFNC